MNGVFLKECTIQYSEGEKHFTILASARTANLFLASVMLMYAVLLFIVELFMMVSDNSISLTDIFILTAVTIFILLPLRIYLQDKSFLDLVDSLGTELEKN